MEIFVDADACPVKEIIVETAKKYHLKVTMITDTSHELNDGYSSIVTVDKGRDSADIKLINLVHKGDIVVTQDYGVAAMALGKGAFPMSQNGLDFSDENMDRLLFERHLGQKIRRSGGKTSAVKKRTKEDDENFRKALESSISANINNTL